MTFNLSKFIRSHGHRHVTHSCLKMTLMDMQVQHQKWRHRSYCPRVWRDELLRDDIAEKKSANWRRMFLKRKNVQRPAPRRLVATRQKANQSRGWLRASKRGKFYAARKP